MDLIQEHASLINRMKRLLIVITVATLHKFAGSFIPTLAAVCFWPGSRASRNVYCYLNNH